MPTSPKPAPKTLPDDQQQIWNLSWSWLRGREAAKDEELVSACIELYGAHYGKWGKAADSPGERVQINRSRFLDQICDEASWVACAFADGELVGYCIAIITEVPGRGRLVWVSQLVVHETYRNARVATRLLYSVWQFSDCYAWGLATAHPFAIRALETATRRPCRAGAIAKNGPEVLEHISEHVSYLPPELIKNGEGRIQPRVDTGFFLDHSEVPRLQELASRKARPWGLGHLEEGQEWFGCTFREQKPYALDDEHLTELLDGADEIWLQAYEGMTLDEQHFWHQHTKQEVSWILERTGITSGSVLDIGCGDGRHTEELASRGLDTTGVDFATALVEAARKRASTPRAKFETLDARRQPLGKDFDMAICLYDVIGSSADPADDDEMLRNIAAALRPGAHLVASVMNTNVTFDRIPAERKPKSTGEFIAALEGLPASDTMESTGAVFNPELLLYYDGVHYRKERFERPGRDLPAELVVRDRRFEVAELRMMFERAGFVVDEIRPVQSGHWDREPALDDTDRRAKELLVVAKWGCESIQV